MFVLLKVTLAAAGSALVASALLVAHKIITNRWSLLRFKKLTKGIPMFGELSLLGNHISTVAVGEDLGRRWHEAHLKLGPYVGGLIGDQFAMSTTDLDLIKRIVIDEGHLHLDRVELNLPLVEYEQSLMLAKGEQWTPQRRVFAPALRSNKFKTPNVISEIEESIGKLVGHIERLLDGTRAGGRGDEAPNRFEIDGMIRKYSLDLVFRCFYKQYNLIDFEAAHCKWMAWMELLFESFQTNPMVKLSMIFPWFRRVVDWLMWHLHELGRARKQVLEFVKRQTRLGIEARQQRPHATDKTTWDRLTLADGSEYTRNLVDHVIDAFLEGKLTREQYLHTSCFVLGAAFGTTADCLTHTLYLLSVHQGVQDKLRKSIVSGAGTESEYLAWVLNESLRLLPPVPVGCSRTISRKIELNNGYVIPSGTFVITNAYAIHRLTKYWGEDACEFRPERWRDTSAHHPVQYVAFGAGGRACLGRDFALFQMKMLLVALLTRYKFSGTVRADAYKFNAPSLIFILPSSRTFVTIERLTQQV